MADFRVIDFVGRTLVEIIRRRIDERFPPAGGVPVHIATPSVFKTLATNATPRVTLFLYRIERNPELLNRVQTRMPDGRLRRQPLPLELCYLITAWGVRTQSTADADAAATRDEHRLLGAVMEALYDSGEVGSADLVESGSSDVWRPEDSLQVALDSLSIEDTYRIWDASELPYRLSVTYRVRVAGLESLRELDAPAVVDARFEAGLVSGGVDA